MDKYKMGTLAGKSTKTKIGSASTRTTSEKYADLAARERLRAETHTSDAVLYHDIRALCLYKSATRKNSVVYKGEIPDSVAIRLRSVDCFMLEKVENGTKISWKRG